MWVLFWQNGALYFSLSQPPTEPDTPVKLHLVGSAVSMIRIPAGVDQLARGHTSANALCQSPRLSVCTHSMMYVSALIWKQRAHRNLCKYL